MKRAYLFVAITLVSALVSASEYRQEAILGNFNYVYNMAESKGQTYLSFMETVIKPAIDEVATNGYEIASPAKIEAVYENVDTKVQGVVEQNGGIENVKRIAKALAGQAVDLNTLPGAIASVDKSVDRYDLATFLGLASGGGVAIQHYEDNFSYNVHYDTTEQKSGRSFGASPTRPPNDASDKAYLNDVTKYSATNKSNYSQFYKTLLDSLLNTDGTNYKNVTALGQTVLTDFLAVYTAEQARNLMDGRIDIHWDAALLEVTLLAGFHAGQTSFKFYYLNPETDEVSFTDTVYNQTPCAVPEKTRKAQMRDYWQFSRRITDDKNCRRSGINITKNEFRKLGEDITKYMAEKYPALSTELKKSMGLEGASVNNVYYALSKFLINDKTPKKLGVKSNRIAAAWVKYLAQVTKSAPEITKQIEKQQ